jgi:PPK2 family polyphosphate:nucleotide phosphotransferase
MKTNDLSRELLTKPGKKVDLAKWDPGHTCSFKDEAEALEVLEKNQAKLAKLQYLLYAQNRHALLVVLQGMDACGKDGTIRHVMHGVNPQACKVTSFKGPTPEELDHDFLWRIHQAAPAKGEIGIFNRSHYEDVLIVRVKNFVPKEVWSRRYKQINQFERILARNGTTIIKFFLHISKDEQKNRLEERLAEVSKRWKFSQADIAERRYWRDYASAYEDVLSRTSTDWAPWFVVPADRKWYRNLAVSAIIVEALESLGMKLPAAPPGLDKLVIE